MIGHGIWAGERLQKVQLVGLVLALAGLVGLLLTGLSAPPVFGSLLMLGAGVAWGVYSLRGRGAGDPIRVTAGNFLCAVPISAALSMLMIDRTSLVHSLAGVESRQGCDSATQCSGHCGPGWYRFPR
jgi:drug/metabolite transporter (DMT)-like permease